jgi:anthranilate/para-aminobenzoate synthase component I
MAAPRASLWARFLWLFQQSAGETALLLGGGEQPPSTLNQWAMAGIRPRQKLVLKQGILRHIGPKGEYCLDLNAFDSASQARDALFARLEQSRQQARFWEAEANVFQLPMAGGLAGALAYSFYPYCDDGWSDTGKSNRNEPDKNNASVESEPSVPAGSAPDLLLCEFEDWLLLDLNSRHLHVLSEDPSRKEHYERLWEESAQVRGNMLQERDDEAIQDRNAYLQTFASSFSAEAFADGVERIREAIQHGELYQANLSLRLQKRVTIDPFALFSRLSHRNPSPFGGFFRWPGGAIASNSPERLVQVNAQGQAQTRPIAGTRGRGVDATEDARIADILLGNEKELAEHRMLLDLARNDLGHVCVPATVQVDALLSIERYAHVTHLVSNVVGQVLPEVTPWQVLQALFPGGTITGCPKVRCVNILHALESVSRGFYTGGLGYINARSPAMDWNILIRSVFFEAVEPEVTATMAKNEDEGTLSYNASVHVGAGIVQDAIGPHEYRECLRKAAATLDALAALEKTTH